MYLLKFSSYGNDMSIVPELGKQPSAGSGLPKPDGPMLRPACQAAELR